LLEPAVSYCLNLAMAELAVNPLLELRKRSERRGACDSRGRARGFPTPWALTLATNGKRQGDAPAIRSLGIQVVDADGIVFVARGAPGGALGCDYDADSKVSICHLAGNYPGADFEEQWRAEGVLEEISFSQWSRLMEGTAAVDAQSLEAQMVACNDFENHRSRESGSFDPTDSAGRLYFQSSAEVTSLHEGVAQRTTDIKDGRLDASAFEDAGLRVYRLKAERMEMLGGGPRWPQGPSRFEWNFCGQWQGPRQILPYSLPRGREVMGASLFAPTALDISDGLQTLLDNFDLKKAVQIEAESIASCILQNTGSQPWPGGSCFRLVHGEAAHGINELHLDEVSAGEVVQLTFEVSSAVSHWVLCTACGTPFGCLLQIVPPGHLSN